MRMSEGEARCSGRFRHGALIACVLLCVCTASAVADDADCLVTRCEKNPPSLKLTRDSERGADAIASFMNGLFEEESDGPDKAIASYRRTLDIDPAFTDLAVKLANDYQRKGETMEAISVLKDTIKARPDEPEPCLVLSAIYLRQLHKPQFALKYAYMALDSSPGLFTPYELLWEIYQSEGQPERAAKVIERASKSENSGADFWLQLAQLQARDLLRLKEGARKVEDTSGGSPIERTDIIQNWNSLSAEGVAKIAALLQKGEAVAGDDAEVISKIADFHILLRQVAKAAPLYREAAKIKPDMPLLRDKLVACYLQLGDSENAIKVLEDIVKDDPLNYNAYDQLSKLYLDRNNYQRALANEEQALLIAPADPLRYKSIIQLCIGQGRFDKALEHINEVFIHYPKTPDILLYQAISLSETKKHQEALKAFEEALIEAENTQPEFLNADFYFYYGEAAEQAGQYARAEELFRKSIDLDPGQAARAYNYLGFMWVDHGQNLVEADKFIRKALEMDPKNGAYLDSLGWLYFKRGQYRDALSELLRAAEALPEPDPEVSEHIGWACQKLGMKTEAALYWQKSLKLEPNNRELSAALDQITQKVAEQPKAPTILGKP